jgi:hypothetical protein
MSLIINSLNLARKWKGQEYPIQLFSLQIQHNDFYSLWEEIGAGNLMLDPCKSFRLFLIYFFTSIGAFT